MEELSRKNTDATNTLKLLGKEGEMSKAIRVLLVDDHELIRQGLRHMLESEEDMWVVGDYASAEEALPETPRLRQDITLMGTQLPGMNMIEATRKLKRNELNHSGDVIILADSVDYQAEALEAGAASYLLKDITRMELAQAIREVHQNRHSLQKRYVLVEEAVELVVPPPANAASLLRFMCQLEDIFHDNDNHTSIVHTVGSWDRGTVITILTRPNTSSSLPIILANMPDVEKVEEEPLARGAFFGFPKKFRSLPRSSISPSKRIRVTLKETGIARQELATVLN